MTYGTTANGDGILINDGTTTYAQDLAAPLSQVLTDGTANYVYGHERLHALGGPWYVGDALGSVRQTLDDAGAVLGSVQYDPWGVPTAGTPQPFGFTGELHRAGQVYLRARWYAPGNGTFTSRDPFAGFPEIPYSLHAYQYAYSNPVRWTDPSGQCTDLGFGSSIYCEPGEEPLTPAEAEALCGPKPPSHPRTGPTSICNPQRGAWEPLLKTGTIAVGGLPSLGRALPGLGMALPLRTGLGLYTVGIFLGSTTPGQAGDLLKAWYLHARGYPRSPALLSVLLDRLCDLLLMGLCATLGVIALGPLLPHPAGSTRLVLGMGSAVLLLALVLIARCSRHWLLLRALPAVLPARAGTMLTRWNRQVGALTLHPRRLLVLTGTSLGAAGVTFVRFWLLFAALDMTLPLTLVIGSTALISILRVLPITIAGLGVQEVVLLAILVPRGYPPEQALSVATLFLLLTLEQILVGYIVSFWYPLGQGQTNPYHRPAPAVRVNQPSTNRRTVCWLSDQRRAAEPRSRKRTEPLVSSQIPLAPHQSPFGTDAIS